MASLDRAVEIAGSALAGRLDPSGAILIDRCFELAGEVTSEKSKTVAILYFVLENCPEWTIDRYMAEGFEGRVIEALHALTTAAADEASSTSAAARDPTARRIKWGAKRVAARPHQL
ncbi:hypothetical protein [Chthonobacter albigriseus]|uniref:hypothetical protein n=1 Tax=Chthonobacter albigriseus TaxID=1683161 RepID=UPI0015EF1425|nr:hypothetical protein [Chthonobacter albigriseus]